MLLAGFRRAHRAFSFTRLNNPRHTANGQLLHPAFARFKHPLADEFCLERTRKFPLPCLFAIRGGGQQFRYGCYCRKKLHRYDMPRMELKIATVYYWKLSARDSLGNKWNSQTISFMTATAWPRMLYIDGTTNVRDIGGRRNMDGFMIKQGLFYRSAEFNQTYSVTQKGLAQLMQLGIVCKIDLRNSSENPQIVMPWLRRYDRPVTDAGGGMEPYLNGLMNTHGPICSVFKTMADSRNYPMILHCRMAELIVLRKIFLNDERQPFPALAIKTRTALTQAIHNCPIRSCFINSSHALIIGKDFRQVKVFDLSGRKIGEFSRICADKNAKIAMPFLPNGVYIASFWN
jgi:hypothetical protein